MNGTFYYFGYDALGSQVIVLNSSGTIVGSQLYGPYGNQRYSTGTLPTSIGFTGQRVDSVTGLDYYVARYYDPVVGVFLSVDSVQGNAQGMEPYAYVGGNPETETDPTGHCAIWDIGCDAQTVGGWLSDAGNALGDVGRAVGGWLGDAVGTIGDVAGAAIDEFAGPIGWGILAFQAVSAALNPPKLGCGCVALPQASAYPSAKYGDTAAVNPKTTTTDAVLKKIVALSKATNAHDAGDNSEKRNRQNFGGAYL